MNDAKGHQPGDNPLLITAEEFDRRVEAGENVDHYFDWDRGVTVEPGELSPGQKLAMTEEGRKAAVNTANAIQSQRALNVLLPEWAFDQLKHDAAGQGIRLEDLAQILILQRLDKQRSAS